MPPVQAAGGLRRVVSTRESTATTAPEDAGAGGSWEGGGQGVGWG